MWMLKHRFLVIILILIYKLYVLQFHAGIYYF